MNITLIIGTRLVVIALFSYTLAYLFSFRKKQITIAVLIFQSLGLSFDITATIFMILGSPNSPFTFHGIIGYSSLSAMVFDTILFWRYRVKYGTQIISKGLKIYSTVAYIWWIAAFITGSLLVLLK